MIRILFVDDDPAVLEGLRNVLRCERRRWDMVFAQSGQAALCLLAESRFDILVSDMRMPGMSGLELLESVRLRYPEVVRIALSGYTDHELVAKASLVTHQQLAKPCEPGSLRDVIQRSCSFRDLLANENLRRVVGSLGGLPSAPGRYQELTRALADPAVSMKRLSVIVEKDVGVASRVLKFVNSAYFGSSRTIGSVEEAIVRIGLNALRHMVLTVEVFGAFTADLPEYAPSAMERQALLTARIARRIVTDPEDAESAFAAGLLHDAGKLVLVSRLPDGCRETIAVAKRDGKPLHVAEAEVIGADHAEIGAYLLGMWGLPAAVIDAVARHHRAIPVDAPAGSLPVAVTLARILAREALRASGNADARSAPAGELLESAWEHLAKWRRLAAEEASRLSAA